MPLKQPHEDGFEDQYEAEFKKLAASRGIVIEYRRDRAAIDLGLHLSVGNEVTDTRVWFQFKGIHAATLSLEDFENAADVPMDLNIEHLRQWYRSPEPIYLVVYVESGGCFLAVDTRSIVDSRWGDELFRPTTFKPSQTKVRVRVPKSARLEDGLWNQMLKHSSMRTDGLSYRGNPLGHRYDLRSRMPLRMEPSLYRDLVGSILDGHRFRVDEQLDPSGLFVGSQDEVSLCLGKMFEPYEWVMQLTAELVCDEDGYREDGRPFRVQGHCAVLVHSLVVSRPSIPALQTLAKRLEGRGVSRLLVFVNHHQFFVNHHQSGYDDLPYNCFPEYRQAVQGTGLDCVPQHLEDLGRNILGSSNIYNLYRDKIDWYGISHLKRQHGELFILNHDGSIETLGD